MEVWDVGMGMPMPLPMARMPMSMLMIHGNAFGVGVGEEGYPRGRGAVYSTNMLMVDLGTSVGDFQYLNLDVMLTAELWTVPSDGYPELLQIGENQANGLPFLDAQHPHSSPLMGLTLSDTLAWGDGKNHLKLFAAPRGETTDGPVAFMHRATGMVNPDAPLGHHVGQDSGHISSSVLGASLKLGFLRAEASLFHGMEPEPAQVDLPLGEPDSHAFRIIGEFSPDVMLMASYAYVNQPEPGIAEAERFSASLYTRAPLSEQWTLHNTLIYGFITNIDYAPRLSSVTEEFLVSESKLRVFGRLEVLQRTPRQLGVAGSSEPDLGRWVEAITVGYSRQLAAWDGWELNFGASLNLDLTPPEFSADYAGNPFTYKFFFQIGGMQMYNL